MLCDRTTHFVLVSIVVLAVASTIFKSCLIFLFVSSVLESQVEMKPPVLMPTPYGGRLTWTLPGNTLFVAHLKDKSKIRHLKRWSQVCFTYFSMFVS